jgi:hypothetical protein
MMFNDFYDSWIVGKYFSSLSPNHRNPHLRPLWRGVVSASFLFFTVLCSYTSELFASPGAENMCSPALRESFSVEKGDLTKPEEVEGRDEFLALFANRPIDHISPFNFGGYAVQYAVKAGVPANTIILILLLPLLATIMVFIRHIVGLPSLELFVPIAFSITLVSTGLFAGAILLTTIILASTFGRIILKRVRIMQLPKMALSIFVVAIFVFWALTVSASLRVLTVTQLSIFPILILILLGEKIVSLQLSRSTRETIQITIVTVGMGVMGFAILSFASLRSLILLYPEIILLLIPIDVVMGRYFGLRLTEIFRFRSSDTYASQ